MARTALTLQTTARTGLNTSYTAATADGEGFDNTSERVMLHVKNGGAGATVVTIATPGTVDGLAITDRTVSVPAGEERMIGPFKKEQYNQDDSGGDTGLSEAVFVNTDVQTSVTLAAIKLGAL